MWKYQIPMYMKFNIIMQNTRYQWCTVAIITRNHHDVYTRIMFINDSKALKVRFRTMQNMKKKVKLVLKHT